MTQQRAGVWSVLTATLLLHGCALLCPERADPETVYAELKPFSALARRAAIDERDPANAVVIPESAYLEATRGRTPQSSDEIAQTRARQLNALGNDPTALGMLAPARHSSAGLQFSGSVFIVVRNPTFVAFGRGVEITDYYVAVQELSGRSAWVGSGARVLLGFTAPESLERQPTQAHDLEGAEVRGQRFGLRQVRDGSRPGFGGTNRTICGPEQTSHEF